jgi:hypothetical protein
MDAEPSYALLWLRAFLFTLLFELPVAVWLLRQAEPSLRRRIPLIVFANLATHPAVWFIFPELDLPYLPTVVLAELWAWWIEAAFFFLVMRTTARRAVLVSGLANATSLALGLALRAATGWV